MRVKIEKGFAKGTVKAPPSKSMSHRLLICAGLAKGRSIIHGVSFSQDVLATLDCLSAIGVKYDIRGTTIIVDGIGTNKIKAGAVLNCKESGSTMRFFIPLCLMSNSVVEIGGEESLMKRPMSVYEDICKEKGLVFTRKSSSIYLKGLIKAGTFHVAGNISSQFISGLLFVLPLLDGDSKIIITSQMESQPYINMTIQALKAFGVNVKWYDKNVILVKGNQHYCASEEYVEGDYSGSAYMEALNILGGKVEVEGLYSGSIQGDKVYKQYFMEIEKDTPLLQISNCPDLAPILFAVSAVKGGATFVGTKRLKYKESDRGLMMAQELKKFGVKMDILDNRVSIYPTGFHKPVEVLNSHNDHRIAMACAVLLTVTGGELDGAEAVRKSFPDFFEKLKELGIQVEN